MPMKKKDSENNIKPCSGCPLMRKTINGLYCTRLEIITEYAKQKPCNH